jgi:hypothetical protein
MHCLTTISAAQRGLVKKNKPLLRSREGGQGGVICVKTAIIYRVITHDAAVFCIYFYSVTPGIEMSGKSLNEEIHLTCPVHHTGPVVEIKSDHISIRCCCNFFTRKYISTIDNKLNSSLEDLICQWETDLLLNELLIN